MKTMKRNGINLIFGKNDKEVHENLVKSIQRKWGFSDIYVRNAFLILLSHSILEKYLEEIIYKLKENNINIKQKLSRMGFAEKIDALAELEVFKKKKRILTRLRCFNRTRNAFGHLYRVGHKDYKKFFQSYDISQKMLTVAQYDKIAKLQDMFVYILKKSN